MERMAMGEVELLEVAMAGVAREAMKVGVPRAAAKVVAAKVEAKAAVGSVVRGVVARAKERVVGMKVVAHTVSERAVVVTVEVMGMGALVEAAMEADKEEGEVEVISAACMVVATAAVHSVSEAVVGMALGRAEVRAEVVS